MAFAALFLMATLSANADSANPPPSAHAREEAATRYDRAMERLQVGDDEGALAELTRVQKLAPHPQVLFNMGLLYARLNRPVEAVAALASVLKDPGSLPGTNLARARSVCDEQSRRIAFLTIATNVPAQIEINGIYVGATPLAQPLSLGAGRVIVGASASGHLPVHQEVTLAGEAKTMLRLDLPPTEKPLAHVAIATQVLGVDVSIDGQTVGQTPLLGAIAVAPGRRRIELTRPGYQAVVRELDLADGALAKLSARMEEGVPSDDWGHLILLLDEGHTTISLNGTPQRVYETTFHLPHGPHRLRVERPGHFAFERLVRIRPGQEQVVKISLLPTADTRQARETTVKRRRTAGWSALIGGAALGAGAAAVLLFNQNGLSEAHDARDMASAQYGPGQACAEGNDSRNLPACRAALASADEDLNRHKTIRNFGLVGVGVGVLLAGAGAALVMTTPRNEPPRRPMASAWQVRNTAWLTLGGAGIGLVGAF